MMVKTDPLMVPPIGETATPGDIPGLTLWLKADTITGVANGAQLSYWEDLSGQGNHATNNDSWYQPIYVTNVTSGLPVVRFDGGRIMSTAASSTAATQTIMAMVRPSSTGPSQVVRGGTLQLRIESGYPDITQAYVNTYATSSVQLDTTHFQVATGTYDGSSYARVRVGNMRTGAGETSVSSLGNAAGASIGSGFHGDITEIACWNRVLNDIELRTVIRGLQQKWAAGYTGDVSAPAAPLIVSAATTDDTTPTITGTAEPEATMTVTLNGHTYTADALSDGGWLVNVTDPLSVGNSYPLSVTATDLAGNTSGATSQTLQVVASLPPYPLPSTPKIMPLGDSITEGTTIDKGGYRGKLWDLLVAQDGRQVDFVGSLQRGTDLVDKDHEGHYGWWMKDDPSGNNIYDHVQEWLTDASPDVILLHIGTNDMNGGANRFVCVERLDALLARIFYTSPNVRLVVAAIVPMETELSRPQLPYQDAIPGLVAKYARLGKKIYLSDMRSILVSADYADWLHPAQSGYDKMALAWYPIITDILDNW